MLHQRLHLDAPRTFCAWIALALLLLVAVPAGAAPPLFTFGERRSYPVNQPPRLTVSNSLAAGNFDGDARTDIAVITSDTDGNPAVMLLLSQPNGTFLLQLAALPISGVQLEFDAIAAANLVKTSVGDKLDDLALLAPDLTDPDFLDKLQVFTNLGGTPVTFRAPSGSGLGVGETPAGITALDFSGDGLPDLAVPDMDAGTVYLFRGPNFIQAIGSPIPSGRDLSDLSNILSAPLAVAAGLLNADALPDLAVALNDDQGVAVHLNMGSSTASPLFGTPTVYDTDQATSNDLNPTDVVVADFNHDNRADIALSNEAGTVSIHLNNGNGTFKTAVTYDVTDASADGIATADFNGDGNPDIVTRNGDDTITVLLGNADGTFVINPSLFSIEVGGGLAGLVVADFNNDGKPDVAVAEESDGTVSVLLGGGISPPTLTPTKTGTPTQTLAPTVTPTPSVTPTKTLVPTVTATASPTATLSPTPSTSPTPTPTATLTPTPVPAPAGDANCNGTVELTDIAALEAQLFFSGPRLCDGNDANRDGAVGTADLIKLLRILLPE